MSANMGIEAEALRTAFRLGQHLEFLLLERGMELALRAGTPNVTAEQVESCLSAELFDELITEWKEIAKNGSGNRRTGDRKAGEAA